MKIIKYFFQFIFIIIFFIANAEARPISYNGGHTVMVLSDNIKNSMYYHYSPTYKYSIGVEFLEDKLFNKNYSFLRLTYLINRKNTKNSQRNLYFQSGINPERTKNIFYGIHGDWETRRYFIGFDFKKVESINQNFSEQKYQIGFAPYLGEYGDLHTWIMLKATKNSITGNVPTSSTLHPNYS